MAKKVVVLTLGAVVLLTACHGSPSGMAGAYDNAIYNEESGDLRGFRVWVRDDPNLAVSLKDCSDTCEIGEWFPARIVRDELTFTQVEPWSRSDGTTGERQVRFKAMKEGNALVLTSPDIPGLRELLPPAKSELRR